MFLNAVNIQKVDQSQLNESQSHINQSQTKQSKDGVGGKVC